MMSIEISDHFEDFICGVWVKKCTEQEQFGPNLDPERAHEWYLKEKFTSITALTCVIFSCHICAKIVEAYILEYRNCALFMSFPQTMETVLD